MVGKYYHRRQYKQNIEEKLKVLASKNIDDLLNSSDFDIEFTGDSFLFHKTINVVASSTGQLFAVVPCNRYRNMATGSYLTSSFFGIIDLDQPFKEMHMVYEMSYASSTDPPPQFIHYQDHILFFRREQEYELMENPDYPDDKTKKKVLKKFTTSKLQLFSFNLNNFKTKPVPGIEYIDPTLKCRITFVEKIIDQH